MHLRWPSSSGFSIITGDVVVGSYRVAVVFGLVKEVEVVFELV